MMGRLGLLCFDVFREILQPLPNQGLKLVLHEGRYDFQPQREAGFYFYGHPATLRKRVEFPHGRIGYTFHLAFHINSFWGRQEMLLGPHGFAPPHIDFQVEIYGVSVSFCNLVTCEQGLPLRHGFIVGPGLEDLLAGSFHNLRLFDVQFRLLAGAN